VNFGADDRTFLLRSERSGRGNGRVYTVTYEARDASGNKTTKQATVTVPKSQ
jgi:endo-1,4-beta-xylanase